MTQSQRCPQCGAEFAADASECPACLMRRGFTPTQSEAVGEDGLALTRSLAPARQGEPANGSEAGRDLAVGERFGNYRIVRRLGHGGMGAVYRGIQKSLGRRAAIKLPTAARTRPSSDC